MNVQNCSFHVTTVNTCVHDACDYWLWAYIWENTDSIMQQLHSILAGVFCIYDTLKPNEYLLLDDDSSSHRS